MKKQVLLLMGVGTMLSCSCTLAETTGSYEMGKKMFEKFAATKEERITALSGVVSAFRESAIESPKKAIDFYLSDAAKHKWKMLVDAEFAEQQQSDFFTGAIMLSGSQSLRGGIVGLYNPWWDAILLLKCDATGDNGASRAAICVNELYFVSGETFRGEKGATSVGTRTVVPEKDPLSVELWRVCSATRRSFETCFPVDSEPTWRKCAAMLMGLDMKREMERIQTRSVLRLQHSVGLLKNSRDAGIAAVLTRLARNGNLYELYKHFRLKETRPLLQTFAEIPEMFRRDFTPYCYVPTKKATLYVLVNKKMPRLYVTVSLLSNPTAETSSMEWYDLTQCDELLSVWDNRKEVVK